MPTKIICSLFSFDLLLRKRKGECERVKSSSTGNLVITLVDLLLQCHIWPEFLRNGGRMKLDPFLNVLSWHMVLHCSPDKHFYCQGVRGGSNDSVLVHHSKFILLPIFFPVTVLNVFLL